MLHTITLNKNRKPKFDLHPNVIHFSLGAPKIWSVNFKIMLLASSVILPGLTTYLWSFVLYIGFLSNPAFSTKLLFLPINHWATKSLPIYLISSAMFHLANSIHLPILHSFIFHPLTSSSGWCTFFYQAPLLWNNLPYSLWHSSSISSFKSALKTHLFSYGL